MTDKTWRDHVSPKFASDFELCLQKSIENRDRNAERRKEITGEVYAVECRSNRIRPSRAVAIRQAQDIARDDSRAFQWMRLICEPLERLAREAEESLRNWDRRRAS